MIAGARAILWQRLDAPGNDACGFARAAGGYLIDGQSTDAAGRVTQYRIRAHVDGTTRRVRIGRTSRVFLRRTAEGDWTRNGTPAPELAGATDIDLGFTPATNTLPIRRLALGVGEHEEIRVAWFDLDGETLRPVRQRYTRTGAESYLFENLDSGFTADLRVDPAGLVRDYPGLWRATP